MPPDISNSGQESIRGFLTRFLPKMLRSKSERYGDGWQQETVAPGFKRDYPVLFPQQQGPSFITPTQRTIIPFPFGGTPNPPTEPPPTDDPPGSGSGSGGGGGPEPPGSGSGSGETPGSGSGSGIECPYYFLAETCPYPGSGEPECGVGSGLSLYLCADLECLDGPGSGTGPEVPMDGQVFEYLNRCWILDTAVEYYRENPPPGGQLLPANAVVVSEPTLNCFDDCNQAGCNRENVWFLATPCESCEPPPGTKIPAFCGADWADTVGQDGNCVYFQYGGHCYYVGINSEPIDAIDPLLHEAITRADFQATLESCCQCCEECMYTTQRTPSATDEPCAPEIDCCCGSEFTIAITYDLTETTYGFNQCNDGSYINWIQREVVMTGTYTLSFDGENVTVLSNTLQTVTTDNSLDFAGCSVIPGTPGPAVGVSKPGVSLNGCGVQPRYFWPVNVFVTPVVWGGLACSCDLSLVFTSSCDSAGLPNGVIEYTPADVEGCFPTFWLDDIANYQSICFPGQAGSYEQYAGNVSADLDCEGGTVTVLSYQRAYGATEPSNCYGVYNYQTVTGTISWTVTVEADCDDGCESGPGSGAYL